MDEDFRDYLRYLNSEQRITLGVPKEFSGLNSFELSYQWANLGNSEEERQKRQDVLKKVVKKESERIYNELKGVRGFLSEYRHIKTNESEIKKGFENFILEYSRGNILFQLSELEEYYLKILISRKGKFGELTNEQKDLLEDITKLIYLRFKLEYLRKKSLQEIKGSDDLHIGEIEKVINGEGSNGNVII